MNIPFVVKRSKGGERSYDIYSKLLDDRIVFLNEEVTRASASCIIAQMLFLESEKSNEDILFYINSPGGEVTAGYSIMDTMNYIKCDVSTICIGEAASMAAILLACGTKGKRISLPTSRIMIHQPLGGTDGQATDMEIRTKEILRLKKMSEEILAKATGKTVQKIHKDTERDFFMTAQEALEYGLIDEIITNKA